MNDLEPNDITRLREVRDNLSGVLVKLCAERKVSNNKANTILKEIEHIIKGESDVKIHLDELPNLDISIYGIENMTPDQRTYAISQLIKKAQK